MKKWALLFAKLMLTWGLLSSCQNINKANDNIQSTNNFSSGDTPQTNNSMQQPKVLTEVKLSTHGHPVKLNLEFFFKGFPQCSSYEYLVEVYKNNELSSVHTETKTIKLKEVRCHPCLPSGPVNNCGNTCEIMSLRPLVSYINFDLNQAIKEKSKLTIKIKNFKGLSQLQSVYDTELPDSQDNPKTSVGIKNCINEISDAELTIKFPDVFLNR